MRNIIIVGIMLIFILAFFILPLRGNLTGYAIIRGASGVFIEVLGVQSFYQGPICYSDVRGKIVNDGFEDARNVAIDCRVLDEGLALLGDYQFEFGEVAQRSSEYFSLRIETECVSAMVGQKYQCDVDCDNCI